MTRALAALLTSSFVVAACSSTSSEPPAAGGDGPARSPVERGKYLVAIVGCADCHTPLRMGPHGPEADPDRFMAGHPEEVGGLPAPAPGAAWAWSGSATNTAYAGPWGVSYSANLTPDQNTGLGIWTEDMFVKAMRTGKHMGVSRPILPPMPWSALSIATDDDLKAIYAFLRTLKPVANHVPDAQPAGPFAQPGN